MLSVAVVKGRREPALSDIDISYREDWVRNHCGALTTAYRATPFGEHFLPDILACLQRRPASLLELTLPLLNLLAEAFELAHRLKYSDSPLDGKRVFSLKNRDLPTGLQIRDYYQPFGGFESGLSGLDLLCNMGPRATEVLSAMSGSQNEE